MSACIFTVGIGLVVMALGGGGSLKVGNIQGMTITGGAGAVIIVLGLLGVGC